MSSVSELSARADATGHPDRSCDAVLVVSFGGPEGMDEVMPFLEHVTRGRGVPRERLEEVEHHYARFAGVSPINAQNRSIVAALRAELDAHGIHLPVYLGNRDWHPLLRETLRAMWLGPDILDHLRHMSEVGAEDVVVAPIGFVSDHMEVLYDLDVEASELAAELELGFVRAATASGHPSFVAMIRELLQERLSPDVPRRASGRFPPDHDECPAGCCSAGAAPGPR